MTGLRLPVETERDAQRAGREALGLCGAAGLDSRSAAQMARAVAALCGALFTGRKRPGAVLLTLISAEGRLGVEALARLPAGQRVDVPPVEDLVDELEAGFAAGGEVLVVARKWRAPAPGKAAAGPGGRARGDALAGVSPPPR